MSKYNAGDTIEAQIEFAGSGNATIKIDEREFFVHKKKTANALHLDKVRAVLFKGERKMEAKVVDVLERYKTTFVGTAQVGENHTFVIPDSSKMVVDFFIKGSHDAQNGQKVIVEMIDWEKERKSPRGKITKVLGLKGENETEMNAIMYEYNLPIDFPQEVLNEAELISDVIPESEIKKRRDIRSWTTIGIDPHDSKDADDTIGLHFENGKRLISINIADVSHYVRPGSELDKEAYKRSSSVYLVDRCVPMIPHKLSNGICSLKSGSDKLCYSVIVELNNDGRIEDSWFGRTVVRVDKDYSYEMAQEVIERGTAEVDTEKVILELDRLAKKMRKRRMNGGSMEIGGVEVKFKLDGDGKKPVGVYLKEQKDANHLIEEYMLLANREVARFIKSRHLPCVNRIHEEPGEEKLEHVKTFIAGLGYMINYGSTAEKTKLAINQLMRDSKGTPEENIITTLVIRAQQKAKYSTKNIGHYGLGFENYSHFTSPIRRYSDILAHRLLSKALNAQGYNKEVNHSELDKQCEWISKQEMVATKAQRDSVKYKQAEYLQDRIGQVFDGVVSGVLERGIYVELTESKCEGMIRISEMGGKWTAYPDKYAVMNEFGETIRLGDPIKIVIKSVDLEKKQIDFIKFN
jgi:ribonuclease R